MEKVSRKVSLGRRVEGGGESKRRLLDRVFVTETPWLYLPSYLQPETFDVGGIAIA